MSWIDPRLWGAFLLAAVVAAGGGYWKGHHDADQSATVSKQAKQIRDLTSANNFYRRTTKTLAGISDDAKKKANQALADARTAADGLRKRVAELVAVARRPAAPAGNPPAGSGSDAIDLLAGFVHPD